VSKFKVGDKVRRTIAVGGEYCCLKEGDVRVVTEVFGRWSILVEGSTHRWAAEYFELVVEEFTGPFLVLRERNGTTMFLKPSKDEAIKCAVELSKSAPGQEFLVVPLKPVAKVVTPKPTAIVEEL
jgi:hypothetical protein